MSTVESLQDDIQKLGPSSMRQGDTSYTFRSVREVIEAKQACAPLPTIGDLPGAVFQSAVPRHGSVSRSLSTVRSYG